MKSIHTTESISIPIVLNWLKEWSHDENGLKESDT